MQITAGNAAITPFVWPGFEYIGGFNMRFIARILLFSATDWLTLKKVVMLICVVSTADRTLSLARGLAGG
jgi:hypothetical protein